MNTMLNIIQSNLKEKNIIFELKDQWVWCLTHIIDLAAKKALEDLWASALADEADIMKETKKTEETEEDRKSIVYKVSL